MFRKTLIATAVVGTGLASLAGIASAHESGHAAKGCSNAAEAAAKNSSGKSLGNTTGSPQSLDLSNTCDILNGNKIGSGNNAASALGSIVNGDTTTETRTSNDSTSTDRSTTVTPTPAATTTPVTPPV